MLATIVGSAPLVVLSGKVQILNKVGVYDIERGDLAVVRSKDGVPHCFMGAITIVVLRTVDASIRQCAVTQVLTSRVEEHRRYTELCEKWERESL